MHLMGLNKRIALSAIGLRFTSHSFFSALISHSLSLSFPLLSTHCLFFPLFWCNWCPNKSIYSDSVEKSRDFADCKIIARVCKFNSKTCTQLPTYSKLAYLIMLHKHTYSFALYFANQIKLHGQKLRSISHSAANLPHANLFFGCLC